MRLIEILLTSEPLWIYICSTIIEILILMHTTQQLGKLVLAEVGLGAVETITKSDRTRKKPSDGMDSIIVSEIALIVYRVDSNIKGNEGRGFVNINKNKKEKKTRVCVCVCGRGGGR